MFSMKEHIKHSLSTYFSCLFRPSYMVNLVGRGGAGKLQITAFELFFWDLDI